ncbi:VOC family protein [Solitalea lacus]|uniref:VOC family protein n=1 Tax=Solitalea lacus TaxID=2911172 RepID=UPI001EDA8F41|nr:VOC family protein [Solitalea lacus]UKJ06650.1 VOC family protein [Solitalea lacus]
MKRVTGIGGIFFKCSDVEKQREWYSKHLGIQSGEYGGTFEWRLKDEPDHVAYTAWSPFKADTDYFSPSEKPFMFNYRVENLIELLKVLKEEGITIVGEVEEYPFGKFGWIMDPEGNKIELWEPNDKNYYNENDNT